LKGAGFTYFAFSFPIRPIVPPRRASQAELLWLAKRTFIIHEAEIAAAISDTQVSPTMGFPAVCTLIFQPMAVVFLSAHVTWIEKP
jgi:hypothetical protein